MAENSNIAWTTHTFNPWRGCAKVSPGCKHCYAEQLVTKRQGLPLWGVDAERKIAAESTWKEPLRWQRRAKAAGVRERVFCASLADVFEPRLDLTEPRRRLAGLINETPNLDWLLLTKRPESMARLGREMGWAGDWPANVWAGCTVEDQEQAERRIPHLLGVPARVRFLSVEPLLGPLDLRRYLRPHDCACIYYRRGEYMQHSPNCTNKFCVMAGGLYDCDGELVQCGCDALSWVICGGESGPGARPFDLAWARSLRDQCKEAGAAFFFKQLGDNPITTPGPITWPSKAPKGGDPTEWPEDMRVQQFPEVGR